MNTKIFNVTYKNKNGNKIFSDMKITQNLLKQNNNSEYIKINNELYGVIINSFIRTHKEIDYTFTFTFEEMKYYNKTSNIIILNYIYNKLFDTNIKFKTLEYTENNYSFIMPDDLNFELLKYLIEIIEKLNISFNDKKEYMLGAIFYEKKYTEIKYKEVDLNQYI
jgi:hypothetical protein